KIEWEMVPMGELFVEEGTLPGDDVLSLCGAEGTIWHPSGRWASTIVRLCGGQLILDAEKNFEPVTFLQFNKDAPNQYPIKKIDTDQWEVTFDKIFSPGHEIGFSPRRALSLHDEQSAREQLLRLRFKRSRPAQLEENRAYRGSPVGRQIPQPVPHGVLHGRLQ